MYMKQDKKGFTLVELIVVLVILAILAAIMLPAFTKYIDKAKHQQIILNGRQAYMAAQSQASENYAASVWTAPTNAEVMAWTDLKGEIVTMTFTKKGVVDTTLDKPFRYKENGLIAKFADGEWIIEKDAESGGGDSGGEGSGGSGSGGSITVTDSSGNKHTIHPSAAWADIQDKIIAGWNIESGCVLSDETGTYMCNAWGSPWLRNEDAKNWTVKDLVDRYPGYFIKLNDNCKIWTMDDARSDGKWNTEQPPKKGDLFFYNGKYYVAPTDMGEWSSNEGGWIEVKQ